VGGRRYHSPAQPKNPHVKAFISSLDKGVLADEGTLQEGIVDHRSLVDDAVTDNGVFHHCLGSDGDIRPDDRPANMSPGLDTYGRNDHRFDGLNEPLMAIFQEHTIGVEEASDRAAIDQPRTGASRR